MESRFIFHYNAPLSPNYIKADINIKMTSSEGSFKPLNETVTHHLVPVHGLCSNTFQIFNLWADFYKFQVSISLFLDSSNTPFAKFYYMMSKNFNNAVKILIDLTDNFGMEVQFVNGGTKVCFNLKAYKKACQCW